MRNGERDAITRKAIQAVSDHMFRGVEPSEKSAAVFASSVSRYDNEQHHWAYDQYLQYIGKVVP